jgi:hypothetical protein
VLSLTGLAFFVFLGFSAAEAATGDQEPATAAAPGVEPEFQLTVPTIELQGANVSEAVLRAVFEGKIAEHADELSKLTATQIRIPEIRLRTSIPDAPAADATETVYRDVIFSNIVNGVAESTSIAGADIKGKEGIAVHFGKMSSGTVDLAGLLQYYGFLPTTAPQEMKPLYKDLLFAGGTLSSPSFNCTLGEIKLSEFKARPLKVPFTDLMKVAKELEAAGEDVSPDLTARLVASYGDILSSFESTPMYSSGFDCTGQSEKGPLAVGVKSFTVGAFKPGRYPEISIGGVAVKVGGDRTVSVGNVLFKGFDYSGPLKVLEAANGKLDTAWFMQHYRELVPSFEGWAVSDVKVDLPDEENGGRIASSVVAFDVSLGAYVNGVPTDISSKASHVAFAIPADTGVEYFEQLKGFGIDDVDFSYELAAKWDKAAGDIRIDKLSLNGVDLGTISLSALLGNATPDLFSLDEEVSAKTAYGLTVKQLGIDAEDAGLVTKFIGIMAEMAGQDPAKFRSLTSGKVRGSILSLLGSTPEVDALSDAVGAFLDLGGSLSVTLKSKDAAGIDFDTLQALTANPAAITDLVAIGAKAAPPH